MQELLADEVVLFAGELHEVGDLLGDAPLLLDENVSGPVVIGGRFSAQWVKRDGKWLIRSEVFVALSCAGVGCAAAALP